MSWVARAKVGDRVVCIDAKMSSGFSWADAEIPVVGSVYSITKIVINGRGVVCFHLSGLDYGTVNSEAAGYYASRFKPVRDTTLQVEAIKRAALDVPAKSPETVA